MSFCLDIPTRIISGNECIKQNPSALIHGNKAVIVTGKHGAAASGALSDVTDILNENGVSYILFSEVTENPPLDTVFKAGVFAKDNSSDFVIGIGGGSAMDAAKAVAAIAANNLKNPMDIYDSEKTACPSLPIVLIPTTAGTGSEANPYSVLTLPDEVHKKTFTSRFSWAKTAFIDPKYTSSLSYQTTVSTALDAFAHAMESYLSPKANDMSKMLSVYAGKGIWDVLTEYPDSFTEKHREILSNSACAAGAAISITGTGFPHPLGYSLTLLYGVPHGSACAVFHGDYIEYNSRSAEGKSKLEEFASAIGASTKLMSEYLPALSGVELTLSDEEIKKCVDLIKEAKNYRNSPYVINEEEMNDIYYKHFGARRKKQNA